MRWAMRGAWRPVLLAAVLLLCAGPALAQSHEKISIAGEWRGKPTPEASKPRGHCMTRGVSGGYNADIHRQSMEAVRAALRGEFHLN